MSELEIRTNHHPRPVVDAWELTPKERAEFDYLDWAAIEKGEDSASFVRYRGELYDLSDFEWTGGLGAPDAFKAWDGYRSDSFFSGLVIRYTDESCEYLVVGLYLS